MSESGQTDARLRDLLAALTPALEFTWRSSHSPTRTRALAENSSVASRSPRNTATLSLSLSVCVCVCVCVCVRLVVLVFGEWRARHSPCACLLRPDACAACVVCCGALLLLMACARTASATGTSEATPRHAGVWSARASAN